jgi:hypothetical protein
MAEIWQFRVPEECFLALYCFFTRYIFGLLTALASCIFLYQSHRTAIYEELVMPIRYQSFHGHE